METQTQLTERGIDNITSQELLIELEKVNSDLAKSSLNISVLFSYLEYHRDNYYIFELLSDAIQKLESDVSAALAFEKNLSF